MELVQEAMLPIRGYIINISLILLIGPIGFEAFHSGLSYPHNICTGLFTGLIQVLLLIADTLRTSDMFQVSLCCLLVAWMVIDLPSEPSMYTRPENHQQYLVMSPHTEHHLRHSGVSQQNTILAPIPFLFPLLLIPPPRNHQDPFAIAGSSCNTDGPVNPLAINQQDLFAVAGSSHNIDGPTLTHDTAVANICAHLADGPQLASSSTALQHPVAMGKREVRDLFDQAAKVPAPSLLIIEGYGGEM
ncbi:hypothetical protein BU17DRAFT_65316 [Hysterangium stoloniferum]|nr:hypothetical protein BU17DRAFT_65316 [Hysterangium stoloniferum]